MNKVSALDPPEKIPVDFDWSEVRYYVNNQSEFYHYLKKPAIYIGNEFEISDHRYFGGIILVLPEKI